MVTQAGGELLQYSSAEEVGSSTSGDQLPEIQDVQSGSTGGQLAATVEKRQRSLCLTYEANSTVSDLPVDAEVHHDGSQLAKENHRPLDHGKVTPPRLWALLQQQEFRCALSGRELTIENCCLDHIIPVEKGGEHTMSNVQLIREEVNGAKGNMTVEEFKAMCRDVTVQTGRGTPPPPLS